MSMNPPSIGSVQTPYGLASIHVGRYPVGGALFVELYTADDEMPEPLAMLSCNLAPSGVTLADDEFCVKSWSENEPLIEPLEFECKPRVIDAHAVQDGRVEIVQVDRILDRAIAEIVGLAVDGAGLGAAAGHPHRETTRVVVAAILVRAEAALAVDGAAEFAAPDDERVIEQASLAQIADQGGHPFGLLGHDRMARGGHPLGATSRPALGQASQVGSRDDDVVAPRDRQHRRRC